MIAQYLDISDDFIFDGIATVELSNYDYCVLQLYNMGGANVLFLASNDSGAITGVSDGSIASSQNYLPVVAEELATGSFVANNNSADGMFQFGVVGRYLRLDLDSGSTSSNMKVILMLCKIS